MLSMIWIVELLLKDLIHASAFPIMVPLDPRPLHLRAVDVAMSMDMLYYIPPHIPKEYDVKLRRARLYIRWK